MASTVLRLATRRRGQRIEQNRIVQNTITQVPQTTPVLTPNNGTLDTITATLDQLKNNVHGDSQGGSQGSSQSGSQDGSHGIHDARIGTMPLSLNDDMLRSLNCYRRCSCHCVSCRRGQRSHILETMLSHNIALSKFNKVNGGNPGNIGGSVNTTDGTTNSSISGPVNPNTSRPISNSVNSAILPGVTPSIVTQHQQARLIDDEFVIITLGLFLLIAVGVWQDFFRVFYAQAFPGQENNLYIRLLFVVSITVVMILIIFLVIRWLDVRAMVV